MVILWCRSSSPLVRVIVPVRPGWKSTVPLAGVSMMAWRSDPGPLSSRLVTVVGTQRPSRYSRNEGGDGLRSLDSQRVVPGGFSPGHAECVRNGGLFHLFLNRPGHRPGRPVERRPVRGGGRGHAGEACRAGSTFIFANLFWSFIVRSRRPEWGFLHV